MDQFSKLKRMTQRRGNQYIDSKQGLDLHHQSDHCTVTRARVCLYNFSKVESRESLSKSCVCVWSSVQIILRVDETQPLSENVTHAKVGVLCIDRGISASSLWHVFRINKMSHQSPGVIRGSDSNKSEPPLKPSVMSDKET